jgi:hypothetical protein
LQKWDNKFSAEAEPDLFVGHPKAQVLAWRSGENILQCNGFHKLRPLPKIKGNRKFVEI